MPNSIIDADDLGSTWGALLTYNTPDEREVAIDSLQNQFGNLRRHVASGDISDLRLSRGAVNCIDLSGQSQVFTADEDVGQEVMGWIKSRRVVLLCKEWEWSLLRQRNGRWMNHLDVIDSISTLTISPSEAVSKLLDEGRISELPQRVVVYEYLQHRELFTRFLNTIGADQAAFQSLIDQKGLSALEDDEQDLLLRSDEEIYRYLCAHELSSGRGAGFNRQKFRDLFGDIPFQVGFGLNIAIFEDIIEELSERRCRAVSDFGTVETFAALLTAEGAESRLHEDTLGMINQDAETLYDRLEEVEASNSVVEKGEYIAQYITDEDAQTAFNTLLATLSLTRLQSDEVSPLQLLNFYHRSGIDPELKAHASRLLAQMMKDRKLEEHSNYEKIAEFLSGEGAKLVLLLDGLPLTQDSSVEFLEQKARDERWEVSFGVTLPLSNTETFREGLLSSYDLGQLGGFTIDEENLAHTDLDDLTGEQEDRLIDLLNNDESVIVYDSGIDRSGRHLADIGMKVERHWSNKINEFISRFKTYADILIVADHGLVKTHEQRAIPIPDDADKKGLQHCRPCFTAEAVDRDRTERLNVTQIPVQIPNSGEDCVMLNPNIPNARFGTQQGDRWTHSGISVEESIVPYVIRRRSS